MHKNTIIPIIALMISLLFSSLSSAYVIMDVQAERQAEWDRYQEYKADYIKTYKLEAFSQYLDERNLMNSFGFRPASYYYVPPHILEAKYNPPLQGEAYTTANRGSTSSLQQPSAVKYFGEVINGRHTGFIPSTAGGIYFDHPQMQGSQGILTANNPSAAYSASSYSPYGLPGQYSMGSLGSYGISDYGLQTGSYQGLYQGSYSLYTQDYYNLYPYAHLGYGGYDYNYAAYPYSSTGFNSLDSMEQPRYYARMVEPLSGGYYVVSYY